jgi:hypothetical protein
MSFDFEPEDSWDALDPPGVQIRNLARRIRLVDGRPDPPLDESPDDLLDMLEARIAAAVARPLELRARRRLEQAALDLIYVRSRV